MAILSNACKPDNFEAHNSLKLSLKFCWLWIFHQIKLSWHLALCEKNLDDSIDSVNFSVRGQFPLIRNHSTTFVHSLAIYVQDGLPFARDVSLENSADSYLCFRLALLHSVFYFFFLYRSPPSCLCTIFYSVSSNIAEVLLIKPSANVFVFGDCNVHDKDWKKSEY